MKVRLYRGPFDGKVIKDWQGGSHLVLNGMRKLTRKQRWERFKKLQEDWKPDQNIFPDHISAVYVRTSFVHPDGSVFYEWERPRPPRHS